MRDFSRSNKTWITHSKPVGAGSRTKPLARVSRAALVGSAALALILISAVEAVVVRADNIPAAAFGYLCISLVYWSCALAFLPFARAAKRSLRARWLLMSCGTLSAGGGYALSFAEMHAFTTAAAKPFQIACFNVSEAMYILAIVLFFAGSARSLFWSIRYKLYYSLCFASN